VQWPPPRSNLRQTGQISGGPDFVARTFIITSMTGPAVTVPPRLAEHKRQQNPPSFLDFSDIHQLQNRH
jgi:hypothetical protein